MSYFGKSIIYLFVSLCVDISELIAANHVEKKHIQDLNSISDELPSIKLYADSEETLEDSNSITEVDSFDSKTSDINAKKRNIVEKRQKKIWIKASEDVKRYNADVLANKFIGHVKYYQYYEGVIAALAQLYGFDDNTVSYIENKIRGNIGSEMQAGSVRLLQKILPRPPKIFHDKLVMPKKSYHEEQKPRKREYHFKK